MLALPFTAFQLANRKLRCDQPLGHVPVPFLLPFRAALGLPYLVCKLFRALPALFIVHHRSPFH